MNWDNGFIAFDTETTGTNPNEADIVTAAAVRFDSTGTEVSAKMWLLKPQGEIPEASVAVHGITTEVAQRDGMDYKTGLLAIRDWLEQPMVPLVAFNAQYDVVVLNSNLMRQESASLLQGIPVLCPMVMDKWLDKYVKGSGNRRLQPTCDRYRVTLVDWHTAEADARAAGMLFWAQTQKYRLTKWSPNELERLVIQQREAQEQDYQAWKARQSAPVDAGPPF